MNRRAFFTASSSSGSRNHARLTHLEFPEPIDPDVSYIEDLSGEQYIESTAGNRRIGLAFDHISGQALSPEESAQMIAGLL